MTDILIVGLGPADWDRTSPDAREALLDPARTVIVRTRRHPAVATLASHRSVVDGDDLYDEADTFEDVYDRLAERVISAAADQPVAFAVPGSPAVGEFTVPRIRALAGARGLTVSVMPGESFVDATCLAVGIDPLERGLQVLDGRALPDPLALGVPTIIAQVDVPVVAADVVARLSDVLDADTEITVVRDAGGADEMIERLDLGRVRPDVAGIRTSFVVDAPSGGWYGVVDVMRHLRAECPWDRDQTHVSLVSNLVEETHELIDAIAALSPGEVDHGVYADVEEELGDVLLQVLFHAAIGEEVGALSVDRIAETLRQKLIRRHPHVFGDLEAANAADVRSTWDAVKAREKGPAASVLDGIPTGLPALGRAEDVQRRAARVGFDWPDLDGVVDKVREELAEVMAADAPDAVAHELGDLLFAVINLARHVDADPEVALRQTIHRFERRFRWMEAQRDLGSASLDDLERLWQDAKRQET